MRNLRKNATILAGIGLSLLMTACGGSSTNTPSPATYVLTVNSTNPASGVAITVTFPPTALAVQGTTSFTETGAAGAMFGLTAPATKDGNTFSSWTGCSSASTVNCSVTLNADMTVTANYATPVKITPEVMVTPSSSSITTAQPLTVTVAVSGGAGNPIPTGTVSLTSGSYISAATTLGSGNATIQVPAGSLAVGNDTLTVTYTPDAASSSTYNSATGAGSVTVNAPVKITPEVMVTPSSSSITTAQPLTVTVAVSGGAGNPTPTGTITLTSGSYISAATTLSSGNATIQVPAGLLAAGSNTLTAAYTPDATSFSTYNNAVGAGSVTVTALSKTTPAMAVTPASLSITTAQPLTVTVAVSAPSGDAIPTGSVTLTSGSYTSAAAALSSGNATIQVPAGSLAVGNDTLTVTYTPDAASSLIYNIAKGASAAVTVTVMSSITVDQSSIGPAVTDQLLGMNMAIWYDQSTPEIVPAFQTAGIKAMRWPGGSESDDYHWAANTFCEGSPLAPVRMMTSVEFPELVNELITPAGLDVALTADYGTNATCTGPGDPTEAAAWAASALSLGANVSHITVGNEEYGSWEEDLHTLKNDPTTYANATATGYYPDIKAVDPNVLVGVSVNPGNSPAWDPIVLANAKGSYDFVEYHFYPQAPGQESDTFLVQHAAQELTATINTIKSELATAGEPDTPIYVGEIGSVYTDPGKQSTSITQALFAGQVLGEMMNDGVSRATWWLGFGGCDSDPSVDNFSSSLYGWQSFGGYMVFSDGLPEYGCESTPELQAGILLPTARAFQLFSGVAVNGESVLNASVAGDTTDVRAYAATHGGGTALVLFNDNETTSEPVTVALSEQTTATTVTVETYDKAIYDQSGPPGNTANPLGKNTWAAPTTTTISSPTLPLALTLTPWSMNVVIIK